MKALFLNKIEARAAGPYLALAAVAMLNNVALGLSVMAFGLVFGFFAAIMNAPEAWADVLPTGIGGGGGPFDKIKTKTESFTTSMIDIAVYICAAAICIACYGMFIGKLPKTFGMCIIAGSILIGSSVSIAQYLIK